MNKVYITWEHGDADFETEKSYSFKTIDEMKAFLNFIYDLRGFSKLIGYEGNGAFQDGHEQSIAEWREKIDKKHGGKFGEYVEMDKRYGNNDYSARVEHIWTEINGVKHYIVWTKAIKQATKIKLPAKGSIMNLTTGSINFIGPEIFGGKDKDYLYHSKFDDLGKPKGDGSKASNYPKLKAKVLDCQPQFYLKRGKPEYNFDWTSFHYALLLENERGKFTSEMNGYDADYEKKFGRPLYEKIKVIEV